MKATISSPFVYKSIVGAYTNGNIYLAEKTRDVFAFTQGARSSLGLLSEDCATLELNEHGIAHLVSRVKYCQDPAQSAHMIHCGYGLRLAEEDLLSVMAAAKK